MQIHRAYTVDKSVPHTYDRWKYIHDSLLHKIYTFSVGKDGTSCLLLGRRRHGGNTNVPSSIYSTWDEYIQSDIGPHTQYVHGTLYRRRSVAAINECEQAPLFTYSPPS